MYRETGINFPLNGNAVTMAFTSAINPENGRYFNSRKQGKPDEREVFSAASRANE